MAKSVERTPVDKVVRAGAKVLTAAAGRVAEVASDQGTDLVGGAVHEIRSVGEEILSVGSDVVGQAQHALQGAREKTRCRIQPELGGTVAVLQLMADQGQALLHGGREDAGALLGQAARGASRIRGRTVGRGSSGSSGNIRSFARRHPAAFLGVAVVGALLLAFGLRRVAATVFSARSTERDAAPTSDGESVPSHEHPHDAAKDDTETDSP